ncbi:hypothetical protein [Liberibacter crescens]|nr:hypothetical protein [Liberibacter crescens]AMC12635.1 hypothetical protein RL73_02475 [Liberibacter crescens]
MTEVTNPVNTFITQLRRFDSEYQDISTGISCYSNEHSTSFQGIIESFSSFLVLYAKIHAPKADLGRMEDDLGYAQSEVSDAFHAAWKEEAAEENEDDRYDPREEHFDQRDYL